MDKTLCPECNAENLPNARYCAACGHTLAKPFHSSVSSGSADTLSSVQLVYTPPPGRSKRVIIAIIAALVLVSVLGLAIYAQVRLRSMLPKPQDNSIVEINSDLSETAKELNRPCPLMVDDYTRLDKVSALPDNTLMCSYTLIQSDESGLNTDTMEHYLRPSIVNNIRTNPALKAIRENRVTMVHDYKDKNGTFVLSVTILPEDYE